MLNINQLITKYKNYAILIALMGLLTIHYSGITCNIQSNVYTPCYPISFTIGLLGFISIYVLAYRLKKNIILSWLGMNSLAIMLLHEPLKRIVIKLYAIFLNCPVDVVRESLINSLVITILTLLILVPIVLLVNKYCPFLLGKSLQRKQT